MDREATSLARLLEIEHDCCVRLFRVVDAERTAVARHDVAALLEAVNEREIVQARWQRASKSRAACLADHVVAAKLVNHSAIAPLLARARREAADLRRAQRINAAVVQGALAHAVELLAALRRNQPGSRYDDHAALQAPVPSASRAGWRA
ncbi:MAG: flagellar protein FlgN [Deltaproteobacteria bacterium]|nr:flagellar protein FlgN [Deltaproteobacteria bacterium]